MENKQNKWKFVMTVLLIVMIVMVSVLSVQVLSLRNQIIKSSSGKDIYENTEMEIYLPDTYYAASGLTMEIYNNQITNYGTHISAYDVL